jgi:hypothetical protein
MARPYRKGAQGQAQPKPKRGRTRGTPPGYYKNATAKESRPGSLSGYGHMGRYSNVGTPKQRRTQKYSYRKVKHK